MDKLSVSMEAIIKNDGGTPQDWRELATIINSRPDEAKNFVNQIKPLIREVSSSQQVIALDLLDFLMVECGLPLHTQLSSKDFVTFILTLLKTKDSAEVQFTILTLIKKWGIRFENKRDILPNFYETYNSLTKNNVVFPDNLESTYYKFLGNPEEAENFTNITKSISEMKISEEKNSLNSYKQQYAQENNYGNVSLDLNPENYPKKYRKFVSELVTFLNYITLANEMIDGTDYRKGVDEGVREIVSTIRDLNRNLQMAIENQIEHEGLMAICLGINDDIIKLFKRYDDLKAKVKPEPFLSSFHTDYIAYNLNYGKENSELVKGNYSGVLLNTGNNNISSSLVPEINNNLNRPNASVNLIDFGSSNDNDSIPNNISVSNTSSNQNLSKKDNQKMNDINDIFDAFK